MAEVMCTSPLWGARSIGPMQSTAVLLRCCLLPKYGTIVSSKNDISWGREIMNINLMFYIEKVFTFHNHGNQKIPRRSWQRFQPNIEISPMLFFIHLIWKEVRHVKWHISRSDWVILLLLVWLFLFLFLLGLLLFCLDNINLETKHRSSISSN